MSDTDTIAAPALPWKTDDNGKIIPEPIDLEAIKDIPGDDAYKLRLARMNLLLRVYEQLSAADTDAVRNIKTRAESSYAADPDMHFLEHFLRAYQEWSEERRKYREREREWREREEREDALRKQAREPNKQVLFDALVDLGIHTVDVRFNGSGDEGWIDEITATDASKQEIKLPDTPTITVLTMRHNWEEPISSRFACETCNQNGLHRNVYKVKEAIDQVCDDWLEETHAGWETNDGAHGTFTFNVGNRTVTLDFKQHYIATEDYTHEF